MAALFLSGRGGSGKQVSLHAHNQSIDRLLLALPERLPEENAAFRKGIFGQTACAQQQGSEGFASPNRIVAAKNDFAGQQHVFRFPPPWHWPDSQAVVRSDLEIGLGIPSQNSRQVDLDDRFLFVAALHDAMAEQIRCESMRGLVQASAGPQQIADAHAPLLDREIAGMGNRALHCRERSQSKALARLLASEFIDQVADDVPAAGIVAEDMNRVPPLQLEVRSRPGLLPSSFEIGRKHLDPAIGLDFAPNEYVMRIEPRLQVGAGGQQVREAHAGPPFVAPRLIHVAGQLEGVGELLGDRQHADEIAVLDRFRAGVVESDVLDRDSLARGLPLDLEPLQARRRQRAAGQREGLRQRQLVAQFVDSGPLHFSHHRDRLAHGRHEDRVALLEPGVRPRIAPQQQVVQIER